MISPQKWPERVDSALRAYIDGFITLLETALDDHLMGVYLHGSLAMGSYYPPKSDIDILAVVNKSLPPSLSQSLNRKIALYSDTRPTTGDVEFSIITREAAKEIPNPMPFELHYSSSWHDRILRGEMEYTGVRYDSDLYAHLLCVTNRGYCLLGESIEKAIGTVRWDDFMFAVLDDLDWILADENIVESPYYGVLNICRVMQLLVEKTQYTYNKEEGGVWALSYFTESFIPLIEKALAIYRSDEAVCEETRKTGGVSWDKDILLAFRDHIRKLMPTLLPQT